MRLNSIDIENFTCFDSLRIDFNDIEIFCLENGRGKTSVFNAIIFALYGKLAGKLASYKANPDAKTSVKLNFTLDNEYSIYREINGKAILYKNNEEFKKGATEIFQWVDTAFPYKIAKQLWFSGDIANTELLSAKFFKDQILASKLEDPNKLIDLYKKDKSNIQAQIRSIGLTDISELPVIEKQIKTLQASLKERGSSTDYEYNKALQVKDAVNKLPKEKPSLDIEICNKWKQSRDTSNDIKMEEAKPVGSIPLNYLRTVAQYFPKDLILDKEIPIDRLNYLNDLLDKGHRDDDKIKALKNELAFHQSIKKDDVVKAEEYFKLKQLIDSMPNYQVVIDKYNKENDLAWSKFDQLQSKKQELLKRKDNAARLDVLNNNKIEIDKKLKILQEYVTKASAYYIQSLLDKASETLSNLNSEYDNLVFDDDSLTVMAKNNRLYVSQLSRGEKTMVALSVILAIRDIFSTDLPLVFDESFAALDANNTEKVIELLKNKPQCFIIAHSEQWSTYDNYPSSAKIRTTW